MMRYKNLLAIVFLYNCNCALAQKPEPVIAKAVYRFSHVKDSLNLNNVYTETEILLLAKNSSVYRSYDRFRTDSMFANKNKVKPGDMQIVNPNPGRMGSSTVIYLYPNEKKSFEQDLLVNKYLFPIEYPVIKWKILADTTNIGGQSCQKAVGTWKGRTYDAWFCPKIPFRSGPWKLTGLPGLIMRAVDKKNQVLFEILDFQTVSGTNLTTSVDKDVINTTVQNYHKLYDAFFDDPASFIKGMMPQVSDVKLPGNYKRKPPLNNPLEIGNNYSRD